MCVFGKDRGASSLWLAAAALLLFATLAAAEDPPEFVLKWGSFGDGDGQFRYPRRVAADASGNVYVLDGHTYVIQKFSADGTFISKWSVHNGDNGGFDGAPIDLAADADGNVYVAMYSWDRDIYNYPRVRKYSSDGTYLAGWGYWPDIPAATAITTDASGNVYVAVADPQSSAWGFVEIQRFKADGTFLAQWGSFGGGDGQCWGPVFGLAADASGNVYVTENWRIQKFSRDGTFLARWGSYGTGDGQVDGVTGVAADTAGNVYVVDSTNQRVQKFSGDGSFLTKWGSYGAGDGEFDFFGNTENSGGVAADASGNIYVADTYNNRIQKFAPKSVAMLTEVVDSVVALNLQQGITNSLDAKLDAAFDALTDTVEGNNISAVNALEAFINAVTAQSGNKITADQANALIAEAGAIIDVLEGTG